MADVTHELIHEVLKPRQGRPSNIEHRLGDIGSRRAFLPAQVRGFSVELNGAHTDIGNIHHLFGRIDRRVSHAGKRLDIIEEPAE